MVKKFLIPFLLFIAAPYLSFADMIAIDVDTAVNIALSKNQDIRQYEQDVQVAQAKVQQTVASLYYPDINLGLTFTYLDQDTVNSGNPVVTGVTNVNVWADNYSASLKVNKPIFLGFTLLNSLKLQQINLELAKKKLDSKKNDIIYQAKKDFYNLFLLRENIRLTEEMNIQLSNTLKFTKANYNAGMVSKYDLIRMEVQYQNNQPKLLKLRNAYKIAVMGFLQSLGLPQDTAADFKGSIFDITNIGVPGYNVDQSTVLAKSNDITLIGMQFSMETLKVSKDMAAAGYYPSLNGFFNLGADYKKNTDAAIDADRVFKPSWNFGLALSIPIDDWIPGSKTEASLAEMDSSIEKIKIAMKQYEDTVSLQVKTLYMQIDEANSTLAGQNANVAQAKLGLKLANEKFYAGTISSLDLSDAQILYSQALANYLQAIFDYASAVLKLRRMTGVDSFEKIEQK
jgi:outer membrane protein TolC